MVNWSRDDSRVEIGIAQNERAVKGSRPGAGHVTSCF